jgi:6,7-dimethyl-8-ribityllumazine synthase
MTSSELSELKPGAIAAAAKRVGKSYAGDAEAGNTRVAVAGAKFNGGITERLVGGALDALESRGIAPGSVALAWVPGAFELPLAALRFASSGDFDAVVTLGAVIRGDTAHFDFVAGECAAGCQRVALSTGVPVIFGVLTTDNIAQALERSAPGKENRGYQAALTALEMSSLIGKLPTHLARVL